MKTIAFFSKRRFFDMTASVSLLLFGATVTIWMRGLRVQDFAIKNPNGADNVLIFFGRGGLEMVKAGQWPKGGQWAFQSEQIASQYSFTPAIALDANTGISNFVDLPGFGWYGARGSIVLPHKPIQSSNARAVTVIYISCIYPMLLTAILPLGWILRWQLQWRRKLRRGCCQQCGYDLTGNLSGICPECGTTIKIAV